MRTCAIVNPRSSNGRTQKNWPSIEQQLQSALGPVETIFTAGPMTAPNLTRQALKSGYDQVIAVGGDGTVNEVVNGFFENGHHVNPDAVLGILMSGTGGDFRKTFQIPGETAAQIERLRDGKVRRIDIGKLTYTGFDNNQAVRYFDNIASFGLSGAADQSVNNLKYAKLFGGTFAFQWGILKALLRYKNQPCRVQVDDELDATYNVSTIAVCNGQFFGSGMRMAPHAIPDDGLFDVIITADITLAEQLRDTKKLYTGEHLKNKKVTELRGRVIKASPVDPSQCVLLDVDGEVPGQLPATFEILPAALNLKC
jgi:YegS/Rv2252/BmrU family lipid kinase